MRVILAGYPNSQVIVPMSKYLTSKYLLKDFDYFYLNHKGDVNDWSGFISTFLTYLEDRHVIFALDDYLLSGKLNYQMFANAWGEMDENIVCVKLCHCTQEEHEEYPITTQYCIWDREFLIWLLNRVQTPWQFEIMGSKIFRSTGKKVIHRPCLEYFTNSSISSRWEGVRLDGLKQEDIEYIREHKLLV